MEPFLFATVVYLVAFAVLVTASLIQVRIKRACPGVASYKRSGHRKSSDLKRRKARRRVVGLLLPFMGAATLLTLSYLCFAFQLFSPWVFAVWMITAPLTAAAVLACVVLVACTGIFSKGDGTHELRFS